VQFDTIPNDGRANLPVCPNLTARQRSNAGGTMGIRTRQNIAPLVLVEVWAARQRRPTLVVSSSAQKQRQLHEIWQKWSLVKNKTHLDKQK
jgi:hypothetical protein